RSSLFAFSMCSVLQCGAGAVVRQLIKVGQVQLDTVSSGRNVVHGQARLEHCTPEIESVVVELDAAAFLRRVGQARRARGAVEQTGRWLREVRGVETL